jgi:[acyl-carrier-protein] S-malonyltransferase
MRIAFLFSGQGAQYPGMMKDLYDSESAAQSVFSTADRVLGRSISGLCFGGTQEELNLTHNTQPCVLAADLAAGAVLRDSGVEPDALAGFSLGEYAALTFAGAIATKDVFPMIQFRADAMQAAVAPGKGAMAAIIGVSSDKVEDLCAHVRDEYVIAANYNSPVQTVVSGTAEGVERTVTLAEAEGILCMRLAVSAPFHCALMEPAANSLENYFKTVSFATPGIPVYGNVDGKPFQNMEEIPKLLVRQAMSPVQWVKTIENMFNDGIDTFVECGPGRTLSGLVKKVLKGVTICRVENRKTLEQTMQLLDGRKK